MSIDTQNNRLLLEIDKEIREINRSTINPRIPQLNIKDLKPVMAMVARSRADYLNELFDLASVCGEDPPSPDQIRHLRNLRLMYDELVSGAQALSTAIERGYLDVGRD
ncbi:MAG: hypothetical protein AB2598_06125 [Candidatus Thiodiazotropha sp.]